MKRLAIHAGFPKAGSSAVQSGIQVHLDKLRAEGFEVFGEDLILGARGFPLWFLERQKDTNPAPGTITEIISRTKSNSCDTAIISSENLANPDMPMLFAGIDALVETQIAFYVRPQIEWIPSAWKQWPLKKGLPLDLFVRSCIRQGRPPYLKVIEAWANALPKAEISVFLISSKVKRFDPAIRFFQHIGFHHADPGLIPQNVNQSFDFSILHAMLLNHEKLFSGIHDNRMFETLERVLPPSRRHEDVPLLSYDAAMQIERRFRDENFRMIERFGWAEDPVRLYEEAFLPKKTSSSYMEMSHAELMARAAEIVQGAGLEKTLIDWILPS